MRTYNCVGKESAHVMNIRAIYFQLGIHKPVEVIDDDESSIVGLDL